MNRSALHHLAFDARNLAREARPELTTPERAAALLAPRMAGLDREVCLLAALDCRHRLKTLEVVSIGTVDHTFMAPREICRMALLADASAVVLAHNHPSGDPQPSSDDRLITRRIGQALEIIGLSLLDHLVLGDTWVSLAREGVL